MKNIWKVSLVLTIMLAMVACGGPKKTLMKAEQNAVGERVHAYYEAMRKNGLINFAENGSVELKFAVDRISTQPNQKNGASTAFLNGMGFSLYENISQKDAHQQIELAITKKDNSLPLINCDMIKERLTASLPFTPANDTFFVNIDEAEKQFAEQAKIKEFISLYRAIINSANSQPSEKEVLYALNYLIKDYYSSIDVKEENDIYTYTVSKEQSKEIMLRLAEKITAGLQYQFPVYQTEQFSKSFSEMNDAIKETEGFAYTVQKKVVENKVVASTIIFDSENAKKPQIISKASENEHTISGSFPTKEGMIAINYNAHKKSAWNTDFNMSITTTEKEKVLDVAYSLERTPLETILSAHLVTNDNSKDLDGTMLFKVKTDGDKNNYSMNLDFKSPQKKNSKNIALLCNSTGTFQKRADTISCDGNIVLSSNHKDFADKEMALLFLYKINKEQIRQLDFAKAEEQMNILEQESKTLNNSLQSAMSHLMPALQALGVDMELLSSFR